MNHVLTEFGDIILGRIGLPYAVSEPTGACGLCMEGLAAGIGRTIDSSRGDSLIPRMTF